MAQNLPATFASATGLPPTCTSQILPAGITCVFATRTYPMPQLLDTLSPLLEDDRSCVSEVSEGPMQGPPGFPQLPPGSAAVGCFTFARSSANFASRSF